MYLRSLYISQAVILRAPAYSRQIVLLPCVDQTVKAIQIIAI